MTIFGAFLGGIFIGVLLLGLLLSLLTMASRGEKQVEQLEREMREGGDADI